MDFYGILFDIKNGSKMPYSKNYFDTLFAAKLEELGVKTLTGTLPLTFRTSETALRSWTIYGNNYEHKYSTSGTLPLTFTTHTAGAASDWEIEGNNSIGKNKLEITATSQTINGVTFTVDKVAGTITANGTAQGITQLNLRIGASSGNYYFSGCASGGSSSTYYVVAWDNTASGRAKQWDGVTNSLNDYGAESNEVKVDSGHSVQLTITIMSGYTANNLVFKPMLRPADTSPDFEPYQIGVGERTRNLFDYSDLEIGAYDSNTGEKIPSSAIRRTTSPIDVKPNTSYRISNIKGSIRLFEYAANGAYIGTKLIDGLFTIGSSTYLINLHGSKDYLTETTMLVEGSTAPQTYIPYGYEVPLTISQTGQTDKIVDIYIGDSPLTEGETVSKTSTGVDLELFEGINTVSTSLYNKPETSITYTDYIGVGKYVNGQWQIPLTVTHYTDNIFDKDAKNTNKGYEDSMCIMWAGSIPYPYMTGNEDNNYFVSEKIPCSPNTTYYLSDGIFKNTDNGIYSVFLWNRYRMSDYQAFPTEKTFITGDDTKFIQVCVLKTYADTVMITTKPTETYIPHVEVNNVNVPIDAPLTASDTATKTSTGVDIPTYVDTNTISTTLENKPEMTITYKGG